MGDELKELKSRRRELISLYGDQAQRHPMAHQIGGLNPAAQELLRIRRQIVSIERARRGPQPVLRLVPGRDPRRPEKGYGLIYDVEFRGQRGKLGKDNFGKWYFFVGDGPTVSGFLTLGKVRRAFAQHVEELI